MISKIQNTLKKWNRERLKAAEKKILNELERIANQSYGLAAEFAPWKSRMAEKKAEMLHKKLVSIQKILTQTRKES